MNLNLTRLKCNSLIFIEKYATQTGGTKWLLVACLVQKELHTIQQLSNSMSSSIKRKNHDMSLVFT